MRHPDPQRGDGDPASRRGATLIELLSSMAILSVLLVVLGVALEAALGRFRSGAELTGNHGGARVAAARIEKDLASHLSSRPARLPTLPEGVVPVQRRYFEDRYFLPFEISRTSGTGMGESRSFQNAAPEFDSLAFATALPSALSGSTDPVPALVGYYVAYARNSPLAGSDSVGMKLFRHFRPGGSQLGDGYAGGIVLAVSREINDGSDGTEPLSGFANPAAVRRGRFQNSDIPFLFSRRIADASSFSPLPATQPWPAYPIEERLASPPPTLHPPRGNTAAREDPGSILHDVVYPDEPLCDHVVRFELRPYRRVVSEEGVAETMGAAALNRHIGFGGGEEWPVLVVPDFIEIVIATLSTKAVLTLDRYEDWIIDWEDEDRASWSAQRHLIEREMQTFRFRVQLPHRST